MIYYEIFKEFLSVLYYLASIFLVVGIFVAIKQLKLMKKDIETKNDRAAIEKSIEFLNWFATEFIPESARKENDLDKEKLLNLKGKNYKDFTIEELASFIGFNRQKYESSIKEKYRCEIVTQANQLEFFSAAMTSGLADEKIAFSPLSNTFCNFVEDHYDLYCYIRFQNEDTLFIHTIELYNTWKARINKMGLEKKRQELDNEISKIEVNDMPIIGKN